MGEIRAGPETMAGRIFLALVLSGMALSIIFVLDHVEDIGVAGAGEARAVIQNFINALSILVGFSWEHCFALALEAVASVTTNPMLMKIIFTAAVALVITPAWRNYILVKVIQLNQMQEEETRAQLKRVSKFVHAR